MEKNISQEEKKKFPNLKILKFVYIIWVNRRFVIKNIKKLMYQAHIITHFPTLSE